MIPTAAFDDPSIGCGRWCRAPGWRAAAREKRLMPRIILYGRWYDSGSSGQAAAIVRNRTNVGLSFSQPGHGQTVFAQQVEGRPTHGDRRPVARPQGRRRQKIRGVVFPGLDRFGSPRHETGRTRARACDPSAKPRCPGIARMEGPSGGRPGGGLRLREVRGWRCRSWEVSRLMRSFLTTA